MSIFDRSLDHDRLASVDNLIVSLRAYVTRADVKARKPKEHSGKALRDPPSDWVLVFDTETRTTPDQRLRFGAYQLRNKGRLFEHGFFYEPEVLTADELGLIVAVKADLEAKSEGERVRLLTREEFVEEVFFGSGRDVGAQIVDSIFPSTFPG